MIFKAKDTEGYEHGCLMAPVPDEVYEKIKYISTKIHTEDLMLDQENTIHGIESHPHITIMYGIDTAERAVFILRKLFTRPLRINITKDIEYFDNDDNTVAYLKIKSKDLEDLNKKCRQQFPFDSKHDEYIPHLTLAYLKPGKRIKVNIEPMEYETRYIILNNPDNSNISIYLDSKEQIYIKSNIIEKVLKEARI